MTAFDTLVTRELIGALADADRATKVGLPGAGDGLTWAKLRRTLRDIEDANTIADLREAAVGIAVFCNAYDAAIDAADQFEQSEGSDTDDSYSVYLDRLQSMVEASYAFRARPLGGAR